VITAVHTSVLIDVFGADPTFGARSRDAVRRCLVEGGLIACEVVWAETAAAFSSASAATAALGRLGVTFSALEAAAAADAGTRWRAHRRGAKRERVIADFLIGAHAAHRADRLLTRDRGFYRAAFSDLVVLDPS
jgi:predicted nucleic acid-binding protein